MKNWILGIILFISLNSIGQSKEYFLLKTDTCYDYFGTVITEDTVFHTKVDTIIFNYKCLFGDLNGNLKTGKWTSINNNYCQEKSSIIFSEIEFQNDSIAGEIKIYYPSGNLKFEGYAELNRHSVSLKFYSEKGENWGQRKLSKTEIINKYSNLKMKNN